MRRFPTKAKSVADQEALQPGFCDCDETLLHDAAAKTDYRVKKPKYHSCEYIKRVNGYLYTATLDASPGPSDMWQSRFSRAMDGYRHKVMLEMEEEARQPAL